MPSAKWAEGLIRPGSLKGKAVVKFRLNHGVYGIWLRPRVVVSIIYSCTETDILK